MTSGCHFNPSWLEEDNRAGRTHGCCAGNCGDPKGSAEVQRLPRKEVDRDKTGCSVQLLRKER